MDLSLLETNEDELWAPTEEPSKSVYSRADIALAFRWRRHTAFMSVCMLGGWNRSVVVHASEDETKALQRAFGNAEVRCVELYVAGGGQR